MNSVGRSAIVWYLELGKLSRACIAARVWSCVRYKTAVVATSLVDRVIVERLHQLVWIYVSGERHCKLWICLKHRNDEWAKSGPSQVGEERTNKETVDNDVMGGHGITWQYYIAGAER
jgi:hypothetical protein